MKILLLGVGMQGKAALYDLARSEAVEEIVAADLDLAGLQQFVTEQFPDAEIRCERFDAADGKQLRRLIGLKPDLIVDLLPVACHPAVCKAAIAAGVHVVNGSYPDTEIERLATEAEARGVTILAELGMDPGIDLVLFKKAVDSLDEVHEVVSYGAGFPELEAADNPLHYKVTWSFEGVLRSYLRPARVLRQGRIVEIPASEIFAPDQIHEVEIPGIGRLEAFPNADSLHYLELLGLNRSRLRRMERCVLRWPGHSAIWKSLVDLHLLDDQPVSVDGVEIDRKKFLAAAIEPQIRYKAGERDIVVVRVETRGLRDGRDERVLLQLVARGEPATGLSAMSRTVGFAASIGAQLIGRGEIEKRGLLSPVRDLNYEKFVEELGKRGLEVQKRFEPPRR